MPNPNQKTLAKIAIWTLAISNSWRDVFCHRTCRVCLLSKRMVLGNFVHWLLSRLEQPRRPSMEHFGLCGLHDIRDGLCRWLSASRTIRNSCPSSVRENGVPSTVAFALFWRQPWLLLHRTSCVALFELGKILVVSDHISGFAATYCYPTRSTNLAKPENHWICPKATLLSRILPAMGDRQAVLSQFRQDSQRSRSLDTPD